MNRRTLIVVFALALAGCQCLIDRDVKMDRRCPPSHCESSCKCQPVDRCEAPPS